MNNSKLDLKHILYLLGFCCYLINIFLNQSMFFANDNGYVNFFTKIFLFSIVLFSLGIKIIFFDGFSIKEITVFLFVLICFVISGIKSDNRQLITLFALIVSAKNINFKYVLRVYLFLIISLLFLSFLFSTILEIIPNLQYTRVRDGVDKVRNSFGLSYPTVFAAYLQSIVVAYSYLMDNKKIYNHIFLLCLSMINVYICLEYADARMAAYSIVCYIFIYYFSSVFFKNIANSRSLIILGMLIYPLAFAIIFYLSYYYDSTNDKFEIINSLLSGRLKLGHDALINYGITIFGQKIEFIGLGGAVQSMTEDYNYVDSSFLKFLLSYGAVFSIISILVMVYLSYNRFILGDYKFIAIIFIISLNAMIEDRMLDISITPYWVIVMSFYFYGDINGKRQKCKV
ncbi:MAG: hypothetical protein SPE33_04230 [[Pasteurella] aerogenes]|nr:hypothetical protein [[Pasteurella] aerogenes]